MQGFDLFTAWLKETVVGWVHRYGAGTVTFIGWLVLLVALMIVVKIATRLFNRQSKRKD